MYHEAFIKLYGAFSAAISQIDLMNFGRCKEILKEAIEAAEELAESDRPENQPQE